MKTKFLSIITLLLLSITTLECKSQINESHLIGEWVIDVEKTYESFHKEMSKTQQGHTLSDKKIFIKEYSKIKYHFKENGKMGAFYSDFELPGIYEVKEKLIIMTVMGKKEEVECTLNNGVLIMKRSPIDLVLMRK